MRSGGVTFHPVVLPVLFCSSLVAQQVVLPAVATQWRGPSAQLALFYAPSSVTQNVARVQMLYPLAEVGAVGSIQRLSFRQPSSGSTNSAGSIDVDVRIATSVADPDAPAATFAANADLSAPSVFVGSVSLPATSAGPWPQPWQVIVPLQVPFVLAPAANHRSLVIDVRSRNNTAESSWAVEAYDVDRGDGATHLSQPNCMFPGGQVQRQWSMRTDTLVPGGRLDFILGDYPANQTSVANNALMLGTRGRGGTLGGATLPVALTSLGVPAPVNCEWTVEPLISGPMELVTQTWGAWLQTGLLYRLPDTPAVSGLRFFAQNVAVVQSAAGPQLFPSIAVEFVVGSGARPRGSTVASSGFANPTQGGVFARQPISIRLN